MGLLLTGGAAAGVDRRYTLSDDPEDEVLSIEWSGMISYTHRFSLFGDGRLVGTSKGPVPAAPVVEEPVELRLSPDEVRAIMDIVVDSGLVEFGPDDWWKRLMPEAARNPPEDPPVPMADEAGLSLRVSFASYDSPRRREVSSFVHSAGLGEPTFKARRYRELKEAGRIAESEPDTFTEAEALLHLYDYLERRVYGDPAR